MNGLPLKVQETGPALRYLITASDGYPLAITYGQAGQESDARLFAAAPELLAALDQVDAYLSPFDGEEDAYAEIRSVIQQAIAKAKGE